MRLKCIMVVVCAMLFATTMTFATGRALDRVTPEHWDYKVLMMLEEHGVLTDLQGVQLGTKSYYRYQLTPLVADLVDHRDSMNENDKMLVIRLNDLYRSELLNYRVAKADAVKRQGKDEVPRIIMSDAELAHKMKDFQVDMRSIKVPPVVYDEVVAPPELVDREGQVALAAADEELKQLRMKAHKK